MNDDFEYDIERMRRFPEKIRPKIDEQLYRDIIENNNDRFIIEQAIPEIKILKKQRFKV